MSSFNFHSVLLEISNALSAEQLTSVKFLCPNIGKRKKEECATGLKLFDILMERGELGPNNTGFLRRLLTQIQRPDLCEKLPPTAGDGAPQAHRDELDVVAEVLSENLGRNWRKLGRKLGLSEVKLDSISRKHPTDLEETAVELVSEWRRSRAEPAPELVLLLVQALRGCELNLTADTVEDRLTAP
ncbi:FAS-associated death domain protein [Eucyclogobius newberryi]|uniref:FAS-associated death domain protein n=1 Tax=Eucyclogobius newberryi TaxID=166745 RepID=UPI003B5CB089